MYKYYNANALNKYDNDCVTDDFIERIKMVAQNGFEFNPYMNIAWFDEIAWF